MLRVPARLFRSSGFSWTWLVSGAGVVTAAAAPFFDSSAAAWVALAAAMAAPILRRRPRPRDVDLGLGHGRIASWSPLPFGIRIRGRRLVGASTSYLDDGRALLTMRTSRRTLTLELADAARAKEVRDALGIGHYGFGWLRFETLRSGGFVYAKVLAALAALLMLGCVLAADVAPLALLVASAAILVALVGRSVQGFVDLTGAGIGVFDASHRPGHQFEEIPYASIATAEIEEDQLVVHKRDGDTIEIPLRRRVLALPVGATDDEARALLAQIQSAVARAHGLGPAEPEVVSTIAELRASRGVREWFERVDGLAARLGRAGGYRGAPIAEQDLWGALENHDAEADARAAAARVLVRANPEHRDRIVEIARTALDPRTEQRIRIALLPDDEAERKLAEIVEAEAEAEAPGAGRAAVVDRAST